MSNKNSVHYTLNFLDNNNYDLLSRGKEYELIEKAQNGDKEAEKELIYSNFKLVVHCASQFQCSFLSFDDLVQEGYFGLHEAIYKFDIDLGNKFSTYATWLIKHKISRAIYNKDRVVRIPVYMIENMSKINKAKKHLAKHGDHNPSIEKISQITNISPKNIERAIKNKAYPISIETKVYGKDYNERTIEDFIKSNPDDNFNDNPIEKLHNDFLQSDICKVLKDILNKRELIVIMMKYGINEDKKEYSVKEISKYLKISEQRIRQIEKEALSKIKQSDKADILKKYYNY